MASLNQIRDEIIHSIYDASSLKIDDPYRFLYDADSEEMNPVILSKRVSVNSVSSCISNFKEITFRYQPHNLSLKVGQSTNDKFDVLSKKFIAGELNDHITTMKRRTISAESRLLELASIDPGGNADRLSQLESKVQAECDDALLDLQVCDGFDIEKPYGQRMLHNVTLRLRTIIVQHPNTILNEPFETLMGIVGLLTENCNVWWSKKFNVKDSL